MTRSTPPSGRRTRGHGRSCPIRMRNAVFFTIGSVALCLEYQPAGPLEEILGAPEDTSHGTIRSKCPFTADPVCAANRIGQVHSEDTRIGGIAVDMNIDSTVEGKKNSIVHVAILREEEKRVRVSDWTP
jgi:hypothetical protein